MLKLDWIPKFYVFSRLQRIIFVGTCGSFAICEVENHVPLCLCPPGYTGDPFFMCREIPSTPPPIIDACQPSPCGPSSQCRNINGQAVCSCLPGYRGNPPECRPECVGKNFLNSKQNSTLTITLLIGNSECPIDKACLNQKCVDPCPNTCGIEAQCNVKNHSPVCACRRGYTGDPFTQCTRIRKFFKICNKYV